MDSAAEYRDTDAPDSGTYRRIALPSASATRAPASARFDRAVEWSKRRGLLGPNAAAIRSMLDAEGRGRL